MPEPKDKPAGPAVVNADPSNDDREEALANYGFSRAVINSNPELKKAFKKARAEGWTPQRFIAEIRDTDWFQKHSDAWRTSESLRLTDPSSWKADRAEIQADARNMSARMGAVMSDKQLDRFVDNVQMFGWNPAQQADVLGNYVQIATGGPLKGQYLGDAGKNAAELMKTALNNGYRIPKGKMAEWNKSIMKGDRSVADYQTFVRGQAARAFPTFAEELAAGADLADVASPYLDSMARILEINPNEVTVFDPKIRQALATKDPKSGKPSAKPIYDFESELRNDPRWMKTDNAHQQVMGLGREVLNVMGF